MNVKLQYYQLVSPPLGQCKHWIECIMGARCIIVILGGGARVLMKQLEEYLLLALQIKVLRVSVQ